MPRPTLRSTGEDLLIMEETYQQLYTDVMHIDANNFLVTVTDSLLFTLVFHFEKEPKDKLGLAQSELICSLAFRAFFCMQHEDYDS